MSPMVVGLGLLVLLVIIIAFVFRKTSAPQGRPTALAPIPSPTRAATSLTPALPTPSHPLHPAPAPVYTAPAQPAPAPIHTAPAQPAPAPVYTAPAQPVPAPVYTTPTRPAPAPVYTTPSRPAPAPVYTAPSRPAPAPVYTAPSRPAPVPVYTAPSQPTPAPVYTAPSRPAPAPVYTAPSRPTPAPVYTAPSRPIPAPVRVAPSPPPRAAPAPPPPPPPPPPPAPVPVGWAYVGKNSSTCPPGPRWGANFGAFGNFFGDGYGSLQVATPTSLDINAVNDFTHARNAAVMAGKPASQLPQQLQYASCTAPATPPSAVPALKCPAGMRLHVLRASVGDPGACAPSDATPEFAGEIDGEGQFTLTASAPDVGTCSTAKAVNTMWRMDPSAPAQPYGQASTDEVTPKMAWGSAICLPPGATPTATEVNWAFRDSRAPNFPTIACPAGQTMRVTAAAYGNGVNADGTVCPLVDATAAAARALNGRNSYKFTGTAAQAPFGVPNPCPGVDKAFVGSAVCM